MNGVSVREADAAEPRSASLLKEIETMYDQIKMKAPELFEQHGCALGKEMDSRLNTESQCPLAAPSELEGKEAVGIQVAAPGFPADQFKVNVLPNCIVLSAKTESKKLLRRFYLPVKIDPERVHASFEDGILKIVARKTQRFRPTKRRKRSPPSRKEKSGSGASGTKFQTACR